MKEPKKTKNEQTTNDVPQDQPAQQTTDSAATTTVRRTKSGTFEKGSSKIPGSGRKPGTPNRTTAEFRKYFGTLLGEEWDSDRIRTSLKMLYDINPKLYLDAIFKLAQFNVPALASIELSGDVDVNNPFTEHMMKVAGLSKDIDSKAK